MNEFFAIISLLTICQVSNAQVDNNKALNKFIIIPNEVTETFEKDFQNVDRVIWRKKDNIYEGEFILDGVESWASYNGDGKRMEIRITITNSELPDEVTNFITKYFNIKTIDNSVMIINEINEIKFEVRISINNEDKILFFDGRGNFIKIEN